MSNDTKDSIMVQADITSNELDLIGYLLETCVEWLYAHDTPGIIEDNVLLWNHAELEKLWAKVEAAQDRMNTKLSKLGVATESFNMTNELEDIDFSTNMRGVIDV